MFIFQEVGNIQEMMSFYFQVSVKAEYLCLIVLKAFLCGIYFFYIASYNNEEVYEIKAFD